MVTVVGLGYVGLTTALGFAELGKKVYGIDSDPVRRDSLANGTVDFEEPILKEQLNKHQNNSLFLNEDLQTAINNSTCIFICVGTPCLPDGKLDLKQIQSAVMSCLECIPEDGHHRTIVIKSTVLPGTCIDYVEPIIRNYGYSDESVSVASNPEFLREGFCWEDFMNPSRIVIGANNSDSISELKMLYAGINAPIHVVTPNCAEFSKYLSNIMLATMISFSNEMVYAAKLYGGIDAVKAFHTLHDDHRLKDGLIASYLFPGCGYGGYCLPKDIQAFTSGLEDLGYSSVLLNSVISINKDVTDRLCDEASSLADVTETIGILGLSFKPGTDDVRETPASRIIEGLAKRGFTSIVAYDPLAMDSFKRNYPDLRVDYSSTAEELINRSSIVIIATAWEDFKNLDYSDTVLIDGRYFIKE